MALEDIFEGNWGVGLAVAGAAVLAPTVLPAVGRMVRPIAKTAIKTGMMIYRETLAGVGDITNELVAEARAELDEESRSAPRRTATTGKA